MYDTTQHERKTPDVGETDCQHRPTNGVVRLRKRPTEIEAIQFDGTNHDAIAAFTGGRFWPVDPQDRGDDPEIVAQVYDVLHSTWVGVKVGDWVAKGMRGEFYPIDDAVLAETYEVAGND